MQRVLKQIVDLVKWVPLLFLLMGASSAYALTSGGIDPLSKFAWSNLSGYVNFGTTNGNISVTDSSVSGYAWSANSGWINLSPSEGGVANDGNGNLSGFAWDSSAGWVDFSGVHIDGNGLFHGFAIGGSINGESYAINFDCTYCRVVTTWRPVSATHSGPSGGSAGSSKLGGSDPSPSVSTVSDASLRPAVKSTTSESIGYPVNKGAPDSTVEIPTTVSPSEQKNSRKIITLGATLLLAVGILIGLYLRMRESSQSSKTW